MVCARCGNRLDSMDIFCPGCGAATGSTPGLGQTHRDQKVRWLVTLGIAALAVLTGIEIYSMWPRPDPLDTILQVREAFAHRDVGAFRQYVDEDALLSDGLNQMAGPSPRRSRSRAAQRAACSRPSVRRRVCGF